jgi:3',5'-nucleoside bisphosphate phosphatase
MGDDLERVGIEGAYEGALIYAGNPDMIGRTHFARYLVEQGYCHTTHEVFRNYLVEGKPGFVPHGWATLGDAVRWIRGAGGMAIVAHPARYKFTPTQEYALFSEFKDHGGEGVEVMTGSHSAAECITYADIAKEFGLHASRGSDFHAPGESRTELGSLPHLPGTLTPVWTVLQDRVAHAR